MELSSLLAPEAVRVLPATSSKKRLFQELAEIAAEAHGFDCGIAFDALQARESLGPTGVGHGIALPHARIDGIAKVTGVFVRLEKPLEFGAVDRLPVDLVFALFAPEDSGVDHLKALALVSRTMRDQGLCAKLRVNTEPAALHAVLTARTSSQAA